MHSKPFPSGLLCLILSNSFGKASSISCHNPSNTEDDLILIFRKLKLDPRRISYFVEDDENVLILDYVQKSQWSSDINIKFEYEMNAWPIKSLYDTWVSPSVLDFYIWWCLRIAYEFHKKLITIFGITSLALLWLITICGISSLALLNDHPLKFHRMSKHDLYQVHFTSCPLEFP